MGSDSAFGEPYYGDALRQDNEQKWSALASARREAEEYLHLWDRGAYAQSDGIRILRSLLASEPAKAPFVSRNEEWGLRPDFTTAGVTAPPAGAEVREAAEIIRRIVTNHDARITERGVLVYGQPCMSTGFVEAIEWLSRYDAALRGGQKGGK